jgi:hypothetical protein
LPLQFPLAAQALPTDILRREVEAAQRDTLNMELFDRIASEKKSEITTLVRKIHRMRP